MEISNFLILLSAFSVISGLVTEAIKKLMIEKDNKVYNIIALSVSLIIGCGGTIVYYILNSLVIDTKVIICAILMGFASALVAMEGYDRVKQAIEQFTAQS